MILRFWLKANCGLDRSGNPFFFFGFEKAKKEKRLERIARIVRPKKT